MKVELSKKEEIIISLVIAAVFGALMTGLFNYGYSLGSELSVSRNDLNIPKGQNVSAQSLKQGTSVSISFPPPMYVLEWIEFEVDVNNPSGGFLEINFTRDSKILRTELVYGSTRIMLSGYEEYRLRNSDIDVMLHATSDDVRIESIHIDISRGTKDYNPLLGTLSFTLFVGIFIIPFILRKQT